MKVYSVHFNRPDFIEIQKKCLDKIEGYKLVVINNQSIQKLNQNAGN